MVMKVIIPYFRGGEDAHQLSFYGAMGNSISEIIINSIKHPSKVISLLWDNTSGDPQFNGIKQEFYKLFFFCGGLLLIFKPQLLVMLIPLFAQKFLASEVVLWGINYHYSIEFTAVLSMALIYAVKYIKNKWLSLSIIFITTATSYYFTICTFKKRKSVWYDEVRTNILGEQHYKSNLKVMEINKVLQVIPDKVPISACAILAPHLTNRDELYHYPIIKNAEYIVLVDDESTYYPFFKDEWDLKIKELRSNKDFEVFYDNHKLLIFRRVTK
jgi:uncharacterized membrane protein